MARALPHFYDVTARAADVHVRSLRAAVLLDARIIVSRPSLTSQEEHSVWNSLFKGRMMRPENATTGQQYKQTYAPGDRASLRGEIVNGNVFSVSTWQHPRLASRSPQGRSVCAVAFAVDQIP